MRAFDLTFNAKNMWLSVFDLCYFHRTDHGVSRQDRWSPEFAFKGRVYPYVSWFFYIIFYIYNKVDI